MSVRIQEIRRQEVRVGQAAKEVRFINELVKFSALAGFI